ncbi:sensor domain-containing protein [Cohnella terricola]|uniref:Diguanylate cyclase n=1 Tax=Cohnella terricola TaxID=1289167 RepID=A0A559JR36_9BACL|nr:sensor domain-containing diguanylate cyclase [Cohnella terricola]TVY02327.1 diguanylate cyclase [Cohnella terricola]
MSPSQVIVPIFTHFFPILFFVYMTIDVLARNSIKVEHRLVGATSFCFMLLFAEEYVRQQLPISYSPLVAGLWFSVVGIAIPGVGFHLFIKLTHLEHKFPRYVYPYLFYAPLVVVLMIIFIDHQLVSATDFYQSGIWKLPIYNKPYYVAMTASVICNLLYLIPLFTARANTVSRELRGIYNQLIVGVGISACWFIVFGLFDFGDSLPPYPYLYGGIVWCFFLRRTMKKHDFLNFLDKRYEKLFNLNPAAIVLFDLHGKIKDSNPSAKQLFAMSRLDGANIFMILNEDFREWIRSRQEIKNVEMTIQIGNKRLDVLIDGDYVLVEYQPHMILILRDVTMQMENQREIAFLAYHDPLTRLPNRRYFYENLEAIIDDARSHHHKLALVLIDLDYFKDINDKYGHQVGDEVLLYVADVLRETTSNHGMAARLGGDEFVISIHRASSIQFVESIIHTLQLKLAVFKPIDAQEPIPLGMSIGVSFFPDNGLDGSALINSADKAMYSVKREGRNAYHLLSGAKEL